jgi:hypothetical protein
VSRSGNPLEKYGIQGVRLPVAPLDSLVRSESINVNTSILPQKGSVVFGAGPSLTKVTVNTVFPLHSAESWAHPLFGSFYQDFTPREWDKLLTQLAEQNIVFDLVIAEPNNGGGAYFLGTEDNFVHNLAMIESYDVEEFDGADMYCNIQFTQYRQVSAKRFMEDDGSKGDRIPKTVKIAKGKDIKFWANKYLGSADKWREIWKLKTNSQRKGLKGKNPHKLPIGTILNMPQPPAKKKKKNPKKPNRKKKR